MRIQNRDVVYNYTVDYTIECGISLLGAEVKSIRAGRCNLKGSYCTIQSNGVVLHGTHIARWTGELFERDEKRDRQLLLHKREILRLSGVVSEKGMTLVPLSLYLKNGRVKVELGICRGKHKYDKRRALKERQMEMDARRSLNV